jgi:hypothetical protein
MIGSLSVLPSYRWGAAEPGQLDTLGFSPNRSQETHFH